MADVTRDGTLFTHAEASGQQASVTTPTLNSITANGMVAVCVAYDISAAPGGTTLSVVDDLSVGAVKALTNDAPSITERLEIWYFKNYGGGNRTFTVNLTNSQFGLCVHVIPLLNCDLTTPLEGIAGTSATGANPSSGNVSPAPTKNGSFIIGFVADGGGLPTANAPFADIFGDATNDLDTEGYAQATAAAIAATWTKASAAYNAVAAVFVPAVGGGGGGQAPASDDAYFPLAAPAPGPNLLHY